MSEFFYLYVDMKKDLDNSPRFTYKDIKCTGIDIACTYKFLMLYTMANF